MEDEILNLAVTLGKVGDGERERLGVLCAAAARELERGLREGVSREDCGDVFPLAAAWIALEDLGRGDRCGDVESFTAGGLTIRTGGSGGDDLRRRGRELMEPYLLDQNFSFLGVPG